jgi:hypothetical protein
MRASAVSDPRLLAERRQQRCGRRKRWRLYMLCLCIVVVHVCFLTTFLAAPVGTVPREPRKRLVAGPPPPRPPAEDVVAVSDANVDGAAAEDDAERSNEDEDNDDAAPPPEPPSSTNEETRGTALLGASCLQLARGYWSFEVCVGDEARQFHEIVRGVDRHSVTSLGRFQRTVAAPNATGGLQFYVDGAKCEASSQRRRTEAHITCGEKDRLLSVHEPERCVYKMSVELRSACGSDGD